MLQLMKMKSCALCYYVEQNLNLRKYGLRPEAATCECDSATAFSPRTVDLLRTSCHSTNIQFHYNAKIETLYALHSLSHLSLLAGITVPYCLD